MAFAHPSSVTFNGSAIGSLVGFSGESPRARTTNVTGMADEIVGSGGNTRVREVIDCLGIEPGTGTARLLGMPPFSPLQVGERGTLTITTADGSLSGSAILLSWSVEGSVGDLLRGTASFQFTGE